MAEMCQLVKLIHREGWAWLVLQTERLVPAWKEPDIAVLVTIYGSTRLQGK